MDLIALESLVNLSGVQGKIPNAGVEQEESRLSAGRCGSATGLAQVHNRYMLKGRGISLHQVSLEFWIFTSPTLCTQVNSKRVLDGLYLSWTRDEGKKKPQRLWECIWIFKNLSSLLSSLSLLMTYCVLKSCKSACFFHFHAVYRWEFSTAVCFGISMLPYFSP